MTVSQDAVGQRCSVNKVFLEIWKIYRKTPVPESLSSTLLKKEALLA